MAFTAHKDPERLTERDSPAEVLEAQAVQLAEMIRSAKHFVAFTGAGISTSAGIPDFRGPDGVWTRCAQGREAPRGVSTTSAVPTVTHMALVAMAKAGHLKLLISQNCDGLHRRSGFPPDMLAELHGNTNVEYCEKCRRQYLRDFQVRTAGKVHEHQTGRLCNSGSCDGRLMDSVVNFGESLPCKTLMMGMRHCMLADLVLCLGSSLTVTPAASLPEDTVKRGGKLVICNLQTTPLDPLCCLRIFGRTDELMTRVCQLLNVQPPAWRLRRRLRVDVDDGANGSSPPVATFGCVEEDDTPATVFSQLTIELVDDNDRQSGQQPRKQLAEFNRKTCAEATAFRVRLPRLPCRVALSMTFMGHYGEPDHRLELTVDGTRSPQSRILLEFDPTERQWSCSEL